MTDPATAEAGGAAADGPGADERKGERFPPQARLRRTGDIRRALREGRRVRAGPVDMFVARSAAGRARIGIVVPRHGRSIVQRNRLKRRLREIARRDLLPRAVAAGANQDLVLRARPPAYDLPFERLRAVLIREYRPETFGW